MRLRTRPEPTQLRRTCQLTPGSCLDQCHLALPQSGCGRLSSRPTRQYVALTSTRVECDLRRLPWSGQATLLLSRRLTARWLVESWTCGHPGAGHFAKVTVRQTCGFSG